MNAELLAGNIAAHWVQAGVLATSAVIRRCGCSSLNEPRARLAALHLDADRALPSCRWCSRGGPMNRHFEMSPAATTEAAVAAISAETPAGDGLAAASWLDPSTRGVVAILVAGVAHATAVADLRRHPARADSVGGHWTSRRPLSLALEAGCGVAALHSADRQSWPMDLRIVPADRRASSRIRCARPRISARGHLP